ncbi:MAG: flagellin [Vallitalea sp.]|nr:flagellin [Vallitalea sp.]
MIINHNMMAINTHRQLGGIGVNQSKATEKLSSGMRINRAGDDAAGLAITEKMRGQIRGLNQASRNAQDGISLIQTAEGALNETHDMLQRMRELVVQANNGTNTQDDRSKIQEEITQLSTEITKVAERTQFNKQDLLKGTFGASISGAGTAVDGSTKFKVTYNGADVANTYTLTTDDGTADTLTLTNATTGVTQVLTAADVTSMTAGDTFNFDKMGITIEVVASGDHSSLAANNTFNVTGTAVDLQIGANTGQQMSLNINDMRASALGTGGKKIDAINVGGAGWDSSAFDTDIAAVDAAIKTVSAERSKLGSWQNRLEHTIKNLDTSSENLQSAESRIRDVDMAKEMMNYTKQNILMQAAQSMLAQANQAPQGVLQLLR